MKKLAAMLILIISVQLSIAQPFIGIGMSKSKIEHQMHGCPGWIRLHSGPDQLIYTDGVTTFTYEFLRDTPGRLNRTCVRCIAEFSTPEELNRYIIDKIGQMRLKPNPDNLNLILITDLYNDTIFAVAHGRRLIFSY